MSLPIKKEEISISVSNSKMNAHIAYPTTSGKHPAVIVVMELFGVNANIRDITNQIAALGYVAIAPDFYYRTKVDGDLPYGDEGRNKGFELLHKLRRDEVIEDARETLAFLKSRNDVTDKLGIVGFSMGGHIAYLLATQFNIAAIACFYGGWLTNTEIEISQPEPTITLTKGIAKHNGKLIYFAGANDTHITKDQLDKMEQILKDEKVRYELVVYPDSSHGFFCDQRPADYNVTAHNDAWKRLQRLFENELY